MKGLPKFLKAVRIHSGLTKTQREKAMAQLENDQVIDYEHIIIVKIKIVSIKTWQKFWQWF